MSPFCTISELNEILVENRRFEGEPRPPAFGAPLGGDSFGIFAESFGIRKLKSFGISYGVVWVILSLAVLVEHLLVIDRQTDRRTHDDGKYRASIASRG